MGDGPNIRVQDSKGRTYFDGTAAAIKVRGNLLKITEPFDTGDFTITEVSGGNTFKTNFKKGNDQNYTYKGGN